MTESQKQFEEWALNAVDCFALPFFIMKDEGGKYFEPATELAWQAWQASRAELVVKLPDAEGWTDAGAYSFSVDLRDVQHALDDAGVSYE